MLVKNLRKDRSVVTGEYNMARFAVFDLNKKTAKTRKTKQYLWLNTIKCSELPSNKTFYKVRLIKIQL